MVRRASPWLAVIVVLAACRDRGWKADEARYDLIQVGQVRVATGSVGTGRWKGDATYALVVAHNGATEDLVVSLAGDLTDAAGAVVAPLHEDSLRIPAGGERTFALVDRDQKSRPAATAAKVRVTGAMKVEYDPPVRIEDGHAWQDQGRAVVSGSVWNTGEGDCKVLVIAAFFDAAGVPVQRPSTLFELTGGGKRGTQFVGPPGSVSAQLYVGEVAY